MAGIRAGRSGNICVRMHPLLAVNLDQLPDLCRKHRVKALYLFGSATRDDFDPQLSDLDFVVEFESIEQGHRADAYFELLEGLEQIFRRRVDLVTLPALRNRYFVESFEASKVRLYAAA
jgi:uncharacterized protein